MVIPRWTQILPVASFLALGVALAPWVGAFSRPVHAALGKVSLAFTLSATPVVALAMGVAAALGTHDILAAHPMARRGQLAHTAHYWPAPAVLAAAVVFHAARLRSGLVVAGLAVAFGVLVAGVLYLEWATVDAAGGSYARARWVLTVADHGVALAAFMAVLTGDATPARAGALCGLAAALIAVDLLRQPSRTPDSVAAYSLLTGVIVGGAASRVVGRSIAPVGAALILLLVLYALAGVLQHHLRGRLTWRVRLEYFGLLVVGTLAILRYLA